ncbi:stalk domain-containing protein [Paenibacillus naphthalenovorans]|uniref:stalk domain-containing protein n=1 Tax=Paenibacillus naphthalenovorans TaxID=162209 RepID=UPI003D2D163A
MTALLLEAPELVENSEVLLFEVGTTHPDAYRADISVDFVGSGQFRYVDTEFEDGKIPFYVDVGQFGFDKSLIEQDILTVYIEVYDKNNNLIMTISDVNFMYEGHNHYEVSDRKDKPASASVSAKPTNSKVLVNGKEVSFQAYNINGNNYFKLRDLAMVLNGTEKSFEVAWDGKKNAISLESGKAYTAVGGELVVAEKPATAEAKLSTSTIYIDGKEVELTAYLINGNNYFKLRDVAAVIDFGVTWDGATNTIRIDSSTGYVED